MMRALLAVALVACASSHAPESTAPLPSSQPSAAIVDASPPPIEIVDAHVARPSNYAPVAEILTSPDRVEAFALGSHDFIDTPPSTPHRIAGYPIARALPRPPPSFAHDFAAIVLMDDAYRKEAVQCSLAEKHLGLRFTRGADVVEIAILAACPSVDGISTITARTGGQLEGDLSTRLETLLHATFGAAFAR